MVVKSHGFIACVKTITQNALVTAVIIYYKALAMKKVPNALQSTADVVVNVVNFTTIELRNFQCALWRNRWYIQNATRTRGGLTVNTDYMVIIRYSFCLFIRTML
jgi:hypothetical protein